MGKYEPKRTNERGKRAQGFAERYKLVVANTLFPHEKFRLATWHEPNKKDHLQLDFIMVTQKLRTSLLQGSTRFYPGADFGSDHELLMARFRTKPRRTKKAEITRRKCDAEKLLDPKTAEQYRATIGGKFCALLLIEDVQEQAGKVTKRMNATAAEILGEKKTPQTVDNGRGLGNVRQQKEFQGKKI